MKNRLFLVALITASIIPVMNIQAQQQGKNRDSDSNITSIIEKTEKQELSEQEKEGLLFLYEEEKLARDFYADLYDKWNQKIFMNISRSEQTHMDAVKYLLERYGIKLPEPEDDSSFKNRDLEKLYNDLLEDSMKSYENALKNALLVEEKDIKDLIDEIKLSDNRDINITYQNLMKGSRNHLRSFSRQLSRSGEKYSPVFLSSEDFNRIKNSDMERGGAVTDPDFVF